MSILAVIPARYASSRFPAKPLALIEGKPMIQRVYEATSRCKAFSKVIVATDDERIFETVKGFGGEVEMTRKEHQTGTDRVAEVASRHKGYDVVANVQGDQPFVTLEALEKLIEPYLRDELPEMTTVACPLDMLRGYRDENTVKVICNAKGRAMYFSRAPIPFFRNGVPNAPVYQHIGLYAFRRDFLFFYAMLPPSPLEQAESLEQLRALENGYAIHVGVISKPLLEINAPEDLERAKALLKSGALSL
ncbi:MAG: 3-deoxy-manno-octulosonate cytidylyltransferase [Chloroherpetonaceae bacterium]|nr:3-deoxy-manno-octulosonate cytidylyltransferase [Chloroherpetonaceae bacterium]MDW8437028.1 3-deoxy-manno-octulosonate cytidylyltransferase [Chloroherpetonaceae bacterium]